MVFAVSLWDRILRRHSYTLSLNTNSIGSQKAKMNFSSARLSTLSMPRFAQNSDIMAIIRSVNSNLYNYMTELEKREYDYIENKLVNGWITEGDFIVQAERFNKKIKDRAFA